MSIFNKIFLITGGARGLGKGFAQAVVQRGGKVILVDVLRDFGITTEKELNEVYPGQSVFYEGDVTNELSMRKIWEDGEKKFSGPVKVLVNNAGIFHSGNWKKTVNINFVSLMEMTYLAMEKMSIKKSGDGGTIINIASAAGLASAEVYESIPYFVSKSAVVSLTKSLASSNVLENEGVRVAVMCPTFADTEMVRSNHKVVEMVAKNKLGVMTVERVVADFVKLFEDIHSDKVKNGAIMLQTSGAESQYINLPKMNMSSKI
ncbi:15-hydroxyprostaglandin dehydrogenase [NAD(+)] [Hydra vulgaris]|uniref:15-hydroxyprostaglandin dehydrogenase [NAD(+)] n=1 Tax=Hydra vulgaris TaxID=6087 RepID=UPI000192624C|nr:15-hydroxyprostaglandin dehydrogenase [NAD(+)]-like [Hydra vulgaris]